MKNLVLTYSFLKDEATSINYRGFLYWAENKPHTTYAGQYGEGKAIAHKAGVWPQPLGRTWWCYVLADTDMFMAAEKSNVLPISLGRFPELANSDASRVLRMGMCGPVKELLIPKAMLGGPKKSDGRGPLRLESKCYNTLKKMKAGLARKGFPGSPKVRYPDFEGYQAPEQEEDDDAAEPEVEARGLQLETRSGDSKAGKSWKSTKVDKVGKTNKGDKVDKVDKGNKGGKAGKATKNGKTKPRVEHSSNPSRRRASTTSRPISTSNTVIAVMAHLFDLPTELVDVIIENTLPEGFESLALSCKDLWDHCIPHLPRHNYYRSKYRNFSFKAPWKEDPDNANMICPVVELLMRISTEPIIARYIEHANFSENDVDLSMSLMRVVRLPEVTSEDPFVALFAKSQYLHDADLDWRHYYTEMDTEYTHDTSAGFDGFGGLSVIHATDFLLTLLPNVKILILPRLYTSTPFTRKILEAINLLDVVLFLKLPAVKSCFFGPGPAGSGVLPFQNETLSSWRDLGPGFGRNLVTVDLSGYFLEAKPISQFLQHTPQLKVLDYGHSSRYDRYGKEWDLCNFVTAIEREVGNHLEVLSIRVLNPRAELSPGVISLSGFQQLRKLQVPLEVVSCYTYMLSLHEDEIETENNEPVLSVLDFLPPSITHLSIISHDLKPAEEHPSYVEYRTGPGDARNLRCLFGGFAAKKPVKLPVLEEVNVVCTALACDWYKQECEKLAMECQKSGTVLKQHARRELMHWNKEYLT
ncbi:F-box protein [Glarea lozoyensis ATCC 20868]|uniref:F-box protein n=1 Tax=Glarea lozoyensis (strain ATCC 20868 / MF5171) TaxID=1116229 RepID=S3DVC2_GLAL2|nr:F-box protein [Glarea lozoyensis ATCC 20868]EPE30323.1 F-box protein [Glarea lozoyensis ATCC 20868]